MSHIQLKQVMKRFNNSIKPAVNALDLQMNKGEIITLLGPSGCGKTTTLRMIAGFEQPSSGLIKIDNRVVYGQGQFVPPEKRGIGMVFQDYALFPHLTIEKNVMFGLDHLKMRKRKERAKEVLNLVGLSEYGNRYPNELSGGQQQRVALARALAPNPHVVLMDEPFSNLDAGLREKMRYDVTTILRKANTTAIIVTHDQKDAFAVSDRVVVMKEGIVQQIGTPREMYRCPKNCFVAQFLGKTNLLTGKLDSDLKHVNTCIGKICLPEKTEYILDTVKLSVRPEGCQIAKKGEGHYCGVVERVTYSGEYQELYIRLDSMQANTLIVIYAPIDEVVKVGESISFNIKSDLVALVD